MAGVHFLDAKGPDGLRIYAIGDVHGRLDLLAKMHNSITVHLEEQPVADWRVIHLGDYVDRGPDSRGVLDFLVAARQRDARVLALAGNHDIAFLDFLADPDPDGLFAHFGGRQTALSYGISMSFADPGAFADHHEALSMAVPASHRGFVQGLPFSLSIGDFFFCHAGIRPGVALDSQDPQDLIWIREKFLSYSALHPKLVVHGHTPSSEPEVLSNRINVDTGAFMSGLLTALVIEGADKQIMQVSG